MRLQLPENSSSERQNAAAANQLATLAADLLMEDNNAARTTMAAGGRSVLLSRADEPVRWIDAADLSTLAQFASPEDQTIVAAVGLGASDRFALLTTDGLVRIATRNGDQVELRLLDQTDVTAIEFDRQSECLAIAHHIDSIDFVAIDADVTGELVVKRTIRPSVSSWRSVDRYVVTPLRTLTPQTGELSQTVAALVSGKSSFAIGGGSEEEQEVIQLKIARPVISCSVFIAVMLMLSCLYFARRDF